MGRRPDLSDLDLGTLAKELLESDQVVLSPVQTEGIETHAYRVASNGRIACLRISRSTRAFAKDQWAHEMLGDRLPVPRIWELGVLDNNRAFCLSEWMPGKTLQDLTPTEVKRALPAVFDAWSSIANCNLDNISGYGDFDAETQLAPHETWQEVLQAPTLKATSWDPTWTAPRSKQLTELLDTYNTLIADCPDKRQLVHGDWGSNNLLIADGRVTAVLDWENATIGDPLYDVATRFWTTWPPVTTCMTLQAAHSDTLFANQPHYHKRARCYDLHRGLQTIETALTTNDHTLANWAFNRSLDLAQQTP
ncbi:phosphotransferase family protein [Kribbella sp. C-35]|uniref:phosphotransferase family protein n=1 Tax=Kribbella sp. C-35 TaxID=2789276 RepID=UPI00397A7EEA